MCPDWPEACKDISELYKWLGSGYRSKESCVHVCYIWKAGYGVTKLVVHCGIGSCSFSNSECKLESWSLQLDYCIVYMVCLWSFIISRKYTYEYIWNVFRVALMHICLSTWAILSFDWNMEKMLYARLYEYNEFLVSWCLQCRNRCLVPQSRSLVWVGKDVRRSKQGQLAQDAQGCVQSGLEYFQGRRDFDLSGHPAPGLMAPASTILVGLCCIIVV